MSDELEDGPWEVGEARCLMCGWEWVAVAILDTQDLECPHCAKLAGRFKDKQPIAGDGNVAI